MQITKLGHCCLLIDIEGTRILTDPGLFTTSQNTLKDIQIILITHEHGDHLHVGSLKEVLKNNPTAVVVTNSGVGKILDQEKIPYTVLEGHGTTKLLGVTLAAYDARHEEIYKDFGQVQNTGYFINKRLFYPGDAFCQPGVVVDVLALPIAGPWCKMPDALRYALAVKPRIAFPVHDGTVKEEVAKGAHGIPMKILGDEGIEFISMMPGDAHEF